MKLSHECGVSTVVERAVLKIWEEIQRANANKKILLMEAMLEWVRKFSEHISEQWKVVIFLIGKFNRSKSIRKDQGAKKHTAIVVQENRVYLYDSYV
jgi:hypothetical protein